MYKNIFAELIASSYPKKIENLRWRVNESIWKKRLKEFHIEHVSSIFTYTSVNELRTLYELATSLPSNSIALEIGSHLGASSCYIAAGLNEIDGRLLCVDTWNNETMVEGQHDTYIEFTTNTNNVSKIITPIRKLSTDIIENDIPGKLAFVFIDGDHSYASVKNDIEIVKPYLTHDAIIAFHDCSDVFQGVVRVIGEELATGEWVLVGKVQSLVWLKKHKWTAPSWLENYEII